MSTDDTEGLGGLELLQAAIIVPGALAVCSAIVGFFGAHLISNPFARVPWPAGHFFDATTLVTGALFLLLFGVCVRAHLRVRRRTGGAELLPRVARAVPWVIGASLVAGAVLGVRSSREMARSDEASARQTCARALAPGATASENERCLLAAIRCGRVERRRVTLGESPDVECVREALAPQR